MTTVYEKNGCYLCGRKARGSDGIKFICSSCNVLFDYMMMGLYIGRFQPFHNGHLEVVKRALKEAKKLIIVVTVPLRKTGKDPFSAEERKEMIENALHAEGITDFIIYIVKDILLDSEYAEHVRRNVPGFNVVYVGDNKLNEELFSKAGFRVVASERYFGISSTDVREDMLKKGDKWKGMVPKSVSEHIERNRLSRKLS